MTKKQRVEPEISMPEQGDTTPEGAETAEATTSPGGKTITLEELVPGLEEEIALQAEDGEDAVIDTVAETIATLEAERDAFKDKWTRALAEAENVRRRAERDKSDAQTYGGTRLARDLLSVHDNLERALKAADDELREKAGPFIEGVELTQRELLNAFAKHKIEKVTPETGEKFDPNRHQAMFEAPIPGATPGTIIECMQDGFVIADRLLRPALVGVAKAVVEAPDAAESDSAESATGAPSDAEN